jgi:hypothetical protein
MWRRHWRYIESVVCPRELEIDVDGDAGVGLYDVSDVVDAAINLDVEWSICNIDYQIKLQ